MATKAQLIKFIMEVFAEPNGEAISKSKLDGYKKADLEEFITSKGIEAELADWLANN